MVILQGGDVIVGDSQSVPGLDQEVIVDSTMLEVMNGRRNVACQHHELVKDSAA